MNINKFTQKSIQAVNNMEKIAYEYGNQEIEEEHLLYCLLNQEDSLILKLIEKMEINKDEFQRSLIDALNKRPKVSGGQVYIGKDLNRVLVSAEDEAKAMGDEYVSVEHPLPSPCSVIPTRYPRSVQKLWHHERPFPSGSLHSPGQSAGDQRQPGGYI